MAEQDIVEWLRAYPRTGITAETLMDDAADIIERFRAPEGEALRQLVLDAIKKAWPSNVEFYKLDEHLANAVMAAIASSRGGE